MAKERWANRIVGYSEEDPEQLLASPMNWRIHPTAQQQALDGAISEAGYVVPVLVNDRTARIVDGHLRVSLAMKENEKRARQGLPPFLVPVAHLDISEAEEKLILASLDPLSAMAAADKEQLDALLREISTGDLALQAMLAELAQQEGITPPDFEPVGIDEQGRLDQRAQVTCPECGHTFTP